MDYWNCGDCLLITAQSNANDSTVALSEFIHKEQRRSDELAIINREIVFVQISGDLNLKLSAV